MQNKPKVKFAKIIVSSFVTSIYVQVGHLVIQTNKAKTKPIQTQFVERAKMMQSMYLQRITMKNVNMGKKNKAKTNPICRGVVWSEAGSNPTYLSAPARTL